MAVDTARDNTTIPSGFTYLGQFVDHDLTFDTTPMPERQIDPHAVHNFRTPHLDLDGLYGNGPTAHPHLYDRQDRAILLLGHNQPSADLQGNPIPRPTAQPFRNDLPRVKLQTDAEGKAPSGGTALIGDPRNDENLLVAQTHVAMLKFHNKVCATKKLGFEDTRRIVTWHYQWVVLKDFIARLVTPTLLDHVLQCGPRFYKTEVDSYMPIEFSVAAYRIGHTMVRERYSHNRVFGPEIADLPTLFAFSELSGTHSPSPPLPFEKRIPVPDNWIIDWNRFYAPPTGKPDPNLNFSRRLDPFLAPALGNLPNGSSNADHRNLAVLNLLRGLRMQLPSGQAVAAQLELPREKILQSEQFGNAADGVVARKAGFDTNTPLWYYILKEAEIFGKGERLGPVGANIVAEVFVGVLRNDKLSFLNAKEPFTPDPELGARAGSYTMFDLLQFVGELNPIGRS